MSFAAVVPSLVPCLRSAWALPVPQAAGGSGSTYSCGDVNGKKIKFWGVKPAG